MPPKGSGRKAESIAREELAVLRCVIDVYAAKRLRPRLPYLRDADRTNLAAYMSDTHSGDTTFGEHLLEELVAAASDARAADDVAAAGEAALIKLLTSLPCAWEKPDAFETYATGLGLYVPTVRELRSSGGGCGDAENASPQRKRPRREEDGSPSKRQHSPLAAHAPSGDPSPPRLPTRGARFAATAAAELASLDLRAVGRFREWFCSDGMCETLIRFR